MLTRCLPPVYTYSVCMLVCAGHIILRGPADQTTGHVRVQPGCSAGRGSNSDGGGGERGAPGGAQRSAMHDVPG